MCYDWKDPIKYGEFSVEFYREIDRRFFSNARCYTLGGKSPLFLLLILSLWPKKTFDPGQQHGRHRRYCHPSALEYRSRVGKRTWSKLRVGRLKVWRGEVEA